ncbi:hypothetical protein BD779DRAFT_1613491 [Infundibulicybe gibba]|nr:hypothetical protein BD779DRAFT_1613491 [Infundibulicybe gibba]
MGKRRRIAIDVLSDDESLPVAQLPTRRIQRHTDLNVTDHGLSVSESFHIVPGSPTKPSATCTPPPAGPVEWDTTPSIDKDWDDYVDPPHDFVDPTYVDCIQEKPKRVRTSGDNPLLVWIPEIDKYLSELLRLEGRDPQVLKELCDCGTPLATPIYRCDDCMDIRMFCKDCTVQRHWGLPFHYIKEWNGSHFVRVALKSLGLRYQLGHPIGERCTNPARSFNNDFVVVDTDGIHEIALDFCDCQISQSHQIQLLRSRLFPATTTYPRTAATFRVLEYFQLLSFMSKVSCFEFYHTIARRTDNTGTSPPPDRYSSFLRMVREWRHLKMLKRGGRGHAPSGVSGTGAGELAVLCPACPQPGKNMPSDWRETPPDKRWRHALFLGIDANFRLKRLNVSSNLRDPSLTRGYAYFVDEQPFMQFLEEYGGTIPQEHSTCNNHDAIKSASIRGGKGIATTGVGTIECSRHNSKRAVSVGNLQRGERVRHNSPDYLVVSYDIVCQWRRKLWTRKAVYPESLQIPQEEHQLQYLIPKFHLPAHRQICQTTYSFNYTPGVGRTDGEAPERGWAAINPAANSTKEMGPGSRQDTLNDHFGDYNWRKVSIICGTLLRKVKEAVPAREEHINAFQTFSSALPSASVQEWTGLVRAWEANRNMPNPFESTIHTVSENKVRLELAEEEAVARRRDDAEFIHEDISPSNLIFQGIELEDLQRRLKADINRMSSAATELQQAKLIDRSARLRRRIEAWMEVQLLYIPGISKIRARADEEGGSESIEAVCTMELMLPSQVFTRVNMRSEFLEYEWRLRFAQAHDTLHHLRRHLLLQKHMYTFKDRYGHGQKHHTRSLGPINALQDKINSDALRYRTTREALCKIAALLGRTGWEGTLRHLGSDDIRAVGVAQMEGETEGRRNISWIWMVDGTGEGDQVMQEGLRIEWCKARARAHRWQEECILLQEEMWRVKAFFRWEIDQWQIRADVEMNNDGAEGRRAYALRQANIRSLMLARCEKTWKNVEMWLSLGNPGGTDERIEVDTSTPNL